MSVYKPFTTSDVVVTPFKVNKSFTFTGASEFTASNVGIDRFFGKNTPYISGSDTTGVISTQSQALLYSSIQQLYYSNFIYGQDGSPANLPQFNVDGTITVQGGSGSYQPMYENFLPNTLDANRYFPTGSNETIFITSIPSNLFGENIKPGSFSISSLSYGFEAVDDGQGGLISASIKVGDIIYPHGIAITTTHSVVNLPNELAGTSDITCSFESTMTIYESQYKCTLLANEFNYTQNPSSISGSSNSGVVSDFLTSSYFQPYITTVGLYNNANEAVGKLAQPLQSSNTTDTTILVNLDL